MARIYNQKAVKPSQNKKTSPSEKKDAGTKKDEEEGGRGGSNPLPSV